jgi:hypothetical protein
MSRTASRRNESTTTIRIASAQYLSRLQGITRGYCRTAGLDESSVFEAVIAVTELAHRLFTEPELAGSVELSAVRRSRGIALEILAVNAGHEDRPSVRASLDFPPAAGAAGR